MCAAHSGRVEVLEWLKFSAGVDCTDDYILHVAAQQGHFEVIKWACKRGGGGIRLNEPFRAAEFMAVLCYGGHLDIAKWALAEMFRGTWPGGHLVDITNPIVQASEGGQLKVVKWLLEELHLRHEKFVGPFARSLLIAASGGGNVQLLDYIFALDGFSQATILTAACYRAAIHRGQLDALGWLRERQCAMDVTVLEKLPREEDDEEEENTEKRKEQEMEEKISRCVAGVRWALENGVPLPTDWCAQLDDRPKLRACVWSTKGLERVVRLVTEGVE